MKTILETVKHFGQNKGRFLKIFNSVKRLKNLKLCLSFSAYSDSVKEQNKQKVVAGNE